MDDILDRPSVSSSNTHWPAAAQAAVPNPPPPPLAASSHQSGLGTLAGSGSKVSAGWRVQSRARLSIRADFQPFLWRPVEKDDTNTYVCTLVLS